MARGRRGSRVGTMFVLIGCGAILTVTFVVGVYTGRHWPLLTGTPPKVAMEAAKRAAEQPLRPAPTLPTLTFYQELTAPLTAPPPPPPPRPARPKREEPKRDEPKREDTRREESKREEARREETKREEPRREEPRREEPKRELPPVAKPETRPPAPTATAEPARYTVQVAAYRARPPAEALRATLAAAGHDAHVVEIEAGTGARYRVRVGAFGSRDAAREAAARLNAERPLAAFVTAR